MTNCPCGKCERKGCGAYHDECIAYLKWKEGNIKPNPVADTWRSTTYMRRVNEMRRGKR